MKSLDWWRYIDRCVRYAHSTIYLSEGVLISGDSHKHEIPVGVAKVWAMSHTWSQLSNSANPEVQIDGLLRLRFSVIGLSSVDRGKWITDLQQIHRFTSAVTAMCLCSAHFGAKQRTIRLYFMQNVLDYHSSCAKQTSLMKVASVHIDE